MRIKLRRVHSLVLLIIACFVVQTRFALAIGISPVGAHIDNVLPNSSITTNIFLSRGDSSQEIIGRVIISGEAVDYVHGTLGETFIWPVGEATFTYPVVIAPGSLAEGTYTATILATSDPKVKQADTEESGDQVQAGMLIVTGAQTTLSFTVSNEAIESYTIRSVEMNTTEENQPVGFSYVMSNTGNVDTRPARIELRLVDELDPSHTYAETIAADEVPIVPAMTEKTVTILTKLNLTTALYQGTIAFYNKTDEVVYQADAIRLQVFPEGSLDQKGELVSFNTDKPSYQSGEIVLLQAEFKNTGNIGISATFVTEILRDNVRIDLLKQEPVFVPYNQPAELKTTFKPTEGGSYTAVGYVNYGIFTTDQLTAMFTVDDLGLGMVIVFLGIGTVVIGLLIWLLHRRYQKKNFTRRTHNASQPRLAASKPSSHLKRKQPKRSTHKRRIKNKR